MSKFCLITTHNTTLRKNVLPHLINFHGVYPVVNFISLIYFKVLIQTRCLMNSYNEGEIKFG